MKRFPVLLCLLLCFVSSLLYAQLSRTQLLDELNKVIDSSQQYDGRKTQRIQQIKQAYAGSVDKSSYTEYDYYLALYEEYKVFNFDTAFSYARKLQEIAAGTNDAFRMAQSRIKLSFVLLSAGLFKESAELLDLTAITEQPDSLKAEYYLLKGRYYYDLNGYDNDTYYAPVYFRMAGEYLDSALRLFSPASFEYIYYSGLQQMKKGQMDKAYTNFQQLIQSGTLTEHRMALVSSTLSFIYFTRGDTTAATNYQARAAIADIRSSTKETFAMLNLSQLLFGQGDFKSAARYIRKAVDDATSYGARQRKVQVSAILPIIQSSEINYIERQRRTWIIYGAVVSIVLVSISLLLITIYRQNKKLAAAQQVISQTHTELHLTNDRLTAANTALQQANSTLLDVNGKLEEANKIKEEYVGYFFTINSVFFQKIEKFKKAVEQKIHYGKYDEVKHIINSINTRAEKEELLKSFDKAFLKLFPNFVRDFNALLSEENQVRLADDELLNTDLRIYALLRLGIRENEKIAEILEYSVKSIYAYKTKIRNKAKGPKDEFDKKVMELQSVDPGHASR